MSLIDIQQDVRERYRVLRSQGALADVTELSS